MSGRFKFVGTPLPGLTVLERLPIHDHRGMFERLFCQDELSVLLGGGSIVQINHTLSVKQGLVRGLHFQRQQYSEIKFVSCMRGQVFDVAVDLRKDSPTFLRWHAEVLSADNYRTMVIPKGFAHGFQALTSDCELYYFHTAPYCSEAEDGLNARDPRLAIAWPLPIAEQSQKDLGYPMLNSDFMGIVA